MDPRDFFMAEPLKRDESVRIPKIKFRSTRG